MSKKIKIDDGNCLSCGNFFSCKDPNKAFTWVCGDFKNLNDTSQDDLHQQLIYGIQEQKDARLSAEFDLSADESDNIERTILAALDRDISIPLDLEVDDRDIREFGNFYDWCFDGGIDFTPFSRQMWMGLHLFGDICPKCSDPKWYSDIYSVPVDYKSRNLPDRLQLMQNGVCPKCGGRKSNFVKKGQIPNIQELAACIGQRGGKCLHGSTMIATDKGLVRIKSLAPSAAKSGDFVTYDGDKKQGVKALLYKGSKVINAFYTNPPEMLYKVTFDNGTYVIGTADHPLFVNHDFRKIGSIKTYLKKHPDTLLYVNTHISRGVYGKATYDGRELAEEAADEEYISDKVLRGTKDCQNDFLMALPSALAERGKLKCSLVRGEYLLDFMTMNIDHDFIADIQLMFINTGFNVQRPELNRLSYTEEYETISAVRVISVEEYAEEESYDIEVDSKHYFFANFAASHNSITTSSLCSYHIHKLLKTVRPSERYGLTRSTTLTCTYTALSLGRALRLLWTPVRDTIQDSEWFKEYHNFLNMEGKRTGHELLTVKDTYISWRRSRLFASASPPDSGKLRGDTRVQGAVDELGFFRFGAGSEDLVTISADEIHTSLTNSLATVRTSATRLMRAGEDNIMQGLMMNISSPASVFDKIMTLVRLSKNSRTLLGIHLPTWEINPTMTEADLEHYKTTLGMVRFERDFGANPPLAGHPFYNEDVVDHIQGGIRNAVKYKYVERTNKKGVLERAVKLLSTHPLQTQPPALLAIDAGETNNSFSVTIGIPSLKGKESLGSNGSGLGKLIDQRRQHRQSLLNSKLVQAVNPETTKVLIQAVIEVIPPKTGRLNHKKLFSDLIIPLLAPFNVKVAVADRWNSILMLDSLEELGITTFQYSMRYNDFENIRDIAENDALTLPKMETSLEQISNFDQRSYPHCFDGRPIDHLMLQFQTVQDGGRTVNKGDGFTDDTYRSVALATRYLRDTEFVLSYLAGGSIKANSQRALVGIATGTVAGTVAMQSDSTKGLVSTG